MRAAQRPHQRHPADRPQRDQVNGGIMHVRALRGAAGADVERWVAIGRHRLHRPDRGDHIVADVAQGLDHVRPFVRRRNLERLAAAILPRGCRAQQLPGWNDPRDLRTDQIIVESLDLSGAPRRREIPGAIAGLILPCRDVRGSRVPGLRLRDRSDGSRRDSLGRSGCSDEGDGEKQCAHHGDDTLTP